MSSVVTINGYNTPGTPPPFPFMWTRYMELGCGCGWFSGLAAKRTFRRWGALVVMYVADVFLECLMLLWTIGCYRLQDIACPWHEPRIGRLSLGVGGLCWSVETGTWASVTGIVRATDVSGLRSTLHTTLPRATWWYELKQDLWKRIHITHFFSARENIFLLSENLFYLCDGARTES